MARFGFRWQTFVAVAIAVALAGTVRVPVNAAHVERVPKPPATAYFYGGRVYDRFFSVVSLPRAVRIVRGAKRDARLRTLAAAPYGIIDLTPIAGNALSVHDPTLGFGYPNAVDNAGHIPYYDACACAGIDNDVALEINDTGTFSTILYEDDSVEGAGDAVPYGVSPKGDIAGVAYTEYGGSDSYEQVITWSPSGGYLSGATDATYALGINDAGVSVGNDTGSKGSYAAEFSLNARGAVNRALLKPPKNTSWTGVATGINDAGEIVGYATFPGGSGNGRAVRFSTTGYAQVIPVAAAGVSSSAQALNQHGDVIGNAGSQAFLYRNNRVTYLPRPPGDEAGNAVAYAINASDEIVGDIGTSTTDIGTFLYVGGRSYDLGALLPENSGWQIVAANGINDAGQIVGVGYFAGEGGKLAGFSMRPSATATTNLPH